MKAEINTTIKATGMMVDEEALFKEMAKEFNSKTSQATYVDIVHKNKVEFRSIYKVRGTATVELGDLMLITYDKTKSELRICTMQVKYKNSGYRNFLNFRANVFQWEMLKNRPVIINRSSRNFPTNILNFRTDYESITAYGIFYHDNISKDIDFLYVLPKSIQPCKTIALGTLTNGVMGFRFRCPISSGSPNNSCVVPGATDETIGACAMDVFADQVLRGKVGAPVNDSGVMGWLKQWLRNNKANAGDPTVIDTLLEYLDGGEDYVEEDYNFEGSPSALIIITDSEISG